MAYSYFTMEDILESIIREANPKLSSVARLRLVQKYIDVALARRADVRVTSYVSLGEEITDGRA